MTGKSLRNRRPVRLTNIYTTLVKKTFVNYFLLMLGINKKNLWQLHS